jgi:hypothetical protein
MEGMEVHPISSGLEPREGERVLFCRHADVSEDHIDISKKACPSQPFHWYCFLGDNEVTRKRIRGKNESGYADDPMETFKVRWLAICDDCHRQITPAKDATSFARRDAPWIGDPPEITRVI